MRSTYQEWTSEVVVRLGRDIEVLQVSLTMVGNLTSLDLTVLHVDLVSDKNNWDVLTNTGQVTMPVRNGFISNTGGNVKHDDTTVSLNVVSVTQT